MKEVEPNLSNSNEKGDMDERSSRSNLMGLRDWLHFILHLIEKKRLCPFSGTCVDMEIKFQSACIAKYNSVKFAMWRDPEPFSGCVKTSRDSGLLTLCD